MFSQAHMNQATVYIISTSKPGQMSFWLNDDVTIKLYVWWEYTAILIK